ncbi:MAG: hypothetical protein PHI55_12695, partial [Burkholderiaceae bacterium]|nr:hypothetical protein [Burkholderiaceae bacterium]
MSTVPPIAIVQMNPDGSLPIPPAEHAADAAPAPPWQARAEGLQEQVDALQAILAKPLSEILADREKSQEAAAAW